MLRVLTRGQLSSIIAMADALYPPSSAGPQVIDLAKVDLTQMIEPFDTQSRLLMDFLICLSPEAMTELKALVFLGRGDFETWDDALAESKDHGDHGEGDAIYLLEKSPLAEYLRDGAREIGVRLNQ